MDYGKLRAIKDKPVVSSELKKECLISQPHSEEGLSQSQVPMMYSAMKGRL